MKIYHLNILSMIKPELRDQIKKSFVDNELQILINSLNRDRQSKVSYNDVVGMFSYFNCPLGYNDKLYKRFKDINIEDSKYINAYMKKLSLTKMLIYFLQVLQWKGNKTKIYYRLYSLLSKCNKIEFEIVLNIITNKNKFRTGDESG